MDYGISPTYDIDWVDHVKPLSRGGGTTIDNGVCASSFYNSKKRANSNDNKYLFIAGRPTSDYYYFNEFVSTEIANHLKRFSSSMPSDWYFNRAAFRFMLGLDRIRSKKDGYDYSRDELYYAKSSLKILQKWKKLADKEGTFEERGMLPANLSKDQAELLALKNCVDERQILAHMEVCFPWYDSACDAIDDLAEAVSTNDLYNLRSRAVSNSNLPDRVRSIILDNTEKMIGVFGE